jgi:hypothetical protein
MEGYATSVIPLIHRALPDAIAYALSGLPSIRICIPKQIIPIGAYAELPNIISAPSSPRMGLAHCML